MTYIESVIKYISDEKINIWKRIVFIIFIFFILIYLNYSTWFLYNYKLNNTVENISRIEELKNNSEVSEDILNKLTNVQINSFNRIDQSFISFLKINLSTSEIQNDEEEWTIKNNQITETELYSIIRKIWNFILNFISIQFFWLIVIISTFFDKNNDKEYKKNAGLWSILIMLIRYLLFSFFWLTIIWNFFLNFIIILIIIWVVIVWIKK